MRFAVKFAITALLSLGLSTVVAAESNQESIPQPINVHTFQVILSHDEPENDEVGKLQYRGGLDLRGREPRFGGLSGLDISSDGQQLISVTDRENWFTAQLNYNRDGRLVGMSDTIMMPIRAANGTPLTSRADRDAESIMRLSDGSLAVGFERHHRLHRFTELGELAPPMVADNFEGITVRRGRRGETLIYVVSDENFHSLQRTLLLMFSLAE